MSLERYRKPRLVVQSPSTSAHDAARAMESNHVGVVIVQEHRQIVGVVTDRDLAVRVVGHELDARSTTLREIMTDEPVSLAIDATEDEVVRLMRERHVRRVPLTDGDHVVGLVTVDDLLLSGTVDRSVLAEIVRSQLAQPAPLKPRGATQPTARVYGTVLPSHGRRETAEERAEHRHAARAEETYGRLLHRVQQLAELPSREAAGTALELVLGAIVRRILPQEAADLVAQLPSLLQDRMLDLPAGPDRSVTRASVEQALSRRLDVDPDRAARIVLDVGAALEHAVSAGEIDDVRNQLPRDMRGIFPSAA
jgi:CBS domain-containing protein/uncharacterized protein (DUF2267 family)